MDNSKGIKTLAASTQSLFKDKGSKHYGYAYPVTNLEQVKNIIQQLRSKHPKANHVCYGYRILESEEIREFSTDDGEPNNSAGPPILGQIKSKNLTNALVAVVRYFGGTKLGVPGLINAYKTTAHEALAQAKTIIYEPKVEVELRVNHLNLGPLIQILHKNRIKIVRQAYDSENILIIQVKSADFEGIKAKFGEKVTMKWKTI